MAAEAAGAKKKASSLRKPALRLALFLVLVAFLLTTELCHNHLFLFPSAKIEKTPADYQLAFEDIAFKNVAGKRLAGWYCPAQDPIGAVVLNHGNAGNIGGYIDYARCLTKAGLNVLLYDYQGFGKSEGGASISSLVGDALAAFDYLDSRVGGAEKIAVLGVSLGTPISCAIAAQRPKAAAVILEGAFLPDTELYWRMGTIGTPVAYIISKSLRPDIRPERDIAALNGRPLLMVHGDSDRTTPLFGAARLYEKAPQPKWLWVMEGVGHFPNPIVRKHDSYPQVLAAFLRHVFLGQDFDQPEVKSWAATRRGKGWQVEARIQAPAGPVGVAVITKDNKAVRKQSLPAGSYDVRLEVQSPPLTVSAFVELQAEEPESGAR